MTAFIQKTQTVLKSEQQQVIAVLHAIHRQPSINVSTISKGKTKKGEVTRSTNFCKQKI